MKAFFTLVLSTVCLYTAAQKFDVADFTAKEEKARWLCTYDNVAWQTSDSVMTLPKEEQNLLGKEWFCIEDRGLDTWQAYYGKYVNGQFIPVVQYTYDHGKVARSYDYIDTATLSLYAYALNIAADKRVAGIRDSFQIQFNQYIQRNADNTFTIWILPAFQPNGVALEGGEFIYTMDIKGNVLKDDSYETGKFLGFKVENKPYDVRLNYSEIEKPSLGSVFFALYYAPYFKNITIQNAQNLSMLYNEEGKRYWMHTEAPPASKSDNNKKKK